MENHYATLGVRPGASAEEIKRAFREKAKQVHPDITGGEAKSTARMRRLLGAYKLLLDSERRLEYDRLFRRLFGEGNFSWREFLDREESTAEDHAKLILYELAEYNFDRAIAVWRREGALDFHLEDYLSREDWMDGGFLLAEELAARKCYREAFLLAFPIYFAERQKPYFKHFAEDVEAFLKGLVRGPLRAAVSPRQWIECLNLMVSLDSSVKETASYYMQLSRAYAEQGDVMQSAQAYSEAYRRNPCVRNPCVPQSRVPRAKGKR